MENFYIQATRPGEPGIETVKIAAESAEAAQAQAASRGLRVLNVLSEQDRQQQRQMIMEAEQRRTNQPPLFAGRGLVSAANFCLIFAIAFTVIALMIAAFVFLDQRNPIGAIVAILLIIPSIAVHVALLALLQQFDVVIRWLGRLAEPKQPSQNAK